MNKIREVMDILRIYGWNLSVTALQLLEEVNTLNLEGDFVGELT